MGYLYSDQPGLVNVTPDGIENVSRPLWSPDGDKIVFASLSNFADRQLDIWIMKADGSNPINLTGQ